MKITAQAIRNAREAAKCWDVQTFEEIDARNGIAYDDPLSVEDTIADRRARDDSELWLFGIGVDALERGVPMRNVMVWLYAMKGFTLKEISRKFGISAERARQLRRSVEMLYLESEEDGVA